MGRTLKSVTYRCLESINNRGSENKNLRKSRLKGGFQGGGEMLWSLHDRPCMLNGWGVLMRGSLDSKTHNVWLNVCGCLCTFFQTWYGYDDVDWIDQSLQAFICCSGEHCLCDNYGRRSKTRWRDFRTCSITCFANPRPSIIPWPGMD